MKMKFETPEVSIVQFDATDVICTSGEKFGSVRESSLSDAGVKVAYYGSDSYDNLTGSK